MLPHPPRSPLFPYTTLFRSGASPNRGAMARLVPHPGWTLEVAGDGDPRGMTVHDRTRLTGRLRHLLPGPARWRGQPRSEEHTSELQSLAYLVCRLLLEKKKR